MNRRRIPIHVSTVSLMYCLLSFYWGARLARLMGFDGLQVSPTRGLPKTQDRLEQYLEDVGTVCKIAYVEGAWTDDPNQWDDTMVQVFESPELVELRYRSLIRHCWGPVIRHEFYDKGLVEAHPGMLLWPEEVVALAESTNTELVLDTFHLRRMFWFLHQSAKVPDGFDKEAFWEAWRDWKANLALFMPHIRVVHVQQHRYKRIELLRFIFGLSTELGYILSEVKRECPKLEAFIIELAPPQKPGLKGKLLLAGWALSLLWLMPLVRWRINRL